MSAPVVVKIQGFTWVCPSCGATTRIAAGSLDALRADGWAQCFWCDTKFELNWIKLVAEGVTPVRPTLAEIESELDEFRYQCRFGYGLRQLPAHVRGPLALYLDTWLRERAAVQDGLPANGEERTANGEVSA